MPTFAKKVVYHSELAAAGPLNVMFTSPVRDSKFSGRLPYVHFQVEGDDTEYNYQVENASIRATLDAWPQRQWMRIRAAGSHEAAVLILDPATGAAPQAPAPVPAPAPPAPAAAPRPVAAPPPPAAVPQRDTLAAEYWRCLEAASEVVELFRQRHDGREPSEAERALATALFIEYERSGGQRVVAQPKAQAAPSGWSDGPEGW